MNLVLFLLFTYLFSTRDRLLPKARGCHAARGVVSEEGGSSVSLSADNDGKMLAPSVNKQVALLSWRARYSAFSAHGTRCRTASKTESKGHPFSWRSSILPNPRFIGSGEITPCFLSNVGSCAKRLGLAGRRPHHLQQQTAGIPPGPDGGHQQLGKEGDVRIVLPNDGRALPCGALSFLRYFGCLSVRKPAHSTLNGTGQVRKHTRRAPVRAHHHCTTRLCQTDSHLRGYPPSHTKATSLSVLTRDALAATAATQTAGQLRHLSTPRGALPENQNGTTSTSQSAGSERPTKDTEPPSTQADASTDKEGDGRQGKAGTSPGTQQAIAGHPRPVSSSLLATSHLVSLSDKPRCARGRLHPVRRLAESFSSTCRTLLRKRARRIRTPQQMVSVLGNWLEENEGSLQEGRKKILLLMRHGESEFNEWRRTSFTRLRFSDMIRYDPEMVDVCLTSKGLKQCKGAFEYYSAVRSAIPSFHIDAYLVSPLSRAVQTALNTFGCPVSGELASHSPGQHGQGNLPDRWILAPMLTERTDTTGDVGRDAKSLLEFLETKRRAGEIPTECIPENVLDWTLLRPVNKWWLQLADEELAAAEKVLAGPWLPAVCEPDQQTAGVSNDEGDQGCVRNQVLRAITSTFNFADEAAREEAWKRRLQGSYRYRRVPLETDECVLARAGLLLKALCAVKDARVVLMVGHSIFFRTLTSTPKMANAEILPYELDCETKAIKELQVFDG